MFFLLLLPMLLLLLLPLKTTAAVHACTHLFGLVLVYGYIVACL
jgi:hypothetical protein